MKCCLQGSEIIEKEIEMLRILNKSNIPHIAKIIDVSNFSLYYKSSRYHFTGLILPLYWGDLRSLMNLNISFTDDDVLRMIRQCLCALKGLIIYLILFFLKGIHDCNYFHADIKPCNIMCNPKKNDEDRYELSIIDFGLCSKEDAVLPWPELGTAIYNPPEVALGYTK
jgi:serine/threonine protein kinase